MRQQMYFLYIFKLLLYANYELDILKGDKTTYNISLQALT